MSLTSAERAWKYAAARITVSAAVKPGRLVLAWVSFEAMVVYFISRASWMDLDLNAFKLGGSCIGNV